MKIATAKIVKYLKSHYKEETENIEQFLFYRKDPLEFIEVLQKININKDTLNLPEGGKDFIKGNRLYISGNIRVCNKSHVDTLCVYIYGKPKHNIEKYLFTLRLKPQQYINLPGIVLNIKITYYVSHLNIECESVPLKGSELLVSEITNLISYYNLTKHL